MEPNENPAQAYSPAQPTYENPIEQQPFKMKWFKFLVNFVLWLTAISGVVMGIMYMTGEALNFTVNDDRIASDKVFAAAPSLKTACIISGGMMIVTGILALLTIFQLKGFKKLGPVLLYVVLLLSAVATLIVYLSAASATTDVFKGIPADPNSVKNIETTLRSTGITSFVVSLVIIGLNVIYFNKRKSLFVN